MSAPVLVVGGGISGVACAQALVTAGVEARVVERAGSLGGRLGSVRLDDRPIDTGAAYFTVDDRDDERFAAVAAGWRARKLAGPWTDTLGVWTPQGSRTSSGPDRWAAPGGLRSLVAELAAGLDVQLDTTVERVDAGAEGPLVDGVPHRGVVLAMPDPQAERLLGAGLDGVAAAVTSRAWQPVLSIALVAKRRTWEPFSATFVNDHPRITTLVDDGDRRGDDAPVLVAHTTTDLAAAHLADPWQVLPAVIDAVREVLDAEVEPRWAHVQRWSYAQPAASREQPFLLDASRVALCGDSWGRSKVQTAWESGDALGRALAAQL